MSHHRFFYPHLMIQGQPLLLENEEAHHIKDVMRCLSGQHIEIINGKGQLAQATIVSIVKQTVHLTITHIDECLKTPTLISSALPLLRPGHFDWALEKLVEIGVDHISIYPAELSERKEMSENFHRRVHKIIESATKQSDRLFMPTIDFHLSLKALLDTFCGTCIWAEKNESSIPLLTALDSLTTQQPLLLLSGPEKGWSVKEKELLSIKALPVLLSQTTLRAETAAIVLAYGVMLKLK